MDTTLIDSDMSSTCTWPPLKSRKKLYKQAGFRKREQQILEFLLDLAEQSSRDGIPHRPLFQIRDLTVEGLGSRRTVQRILRSFEKIGALSLEVARDDHGWHTGNYVDLSGIRSALWAAQDGQAVDMQRQPCSARTPAQKAARKAPAVLSARQQRDADTKAYIEWIKLYGHLPPEQLVAQKIAPPPLYKGRLMVIHQLYRTGFVLLKRAFPNYIDGHFSESIGGRFYLSRQSKCWRSKTTPQAMQGLKDWQDEKNSARKPPEALVILLHYKKTPFPPRYSPLPVGLGLGVPQCLPAP